jgi:hypothetical protein
MPPQWREIPTRVLAGKELAYEEDFFPRQDGRVQWIRWSMRQWPGADARIGGALLFTEVITEQVEDRRARGAVSGGTIVAWADRIVGQSIVKAKAGSKRPAIRARSCAYGERSDEVLEYMRRIISTEPQGQL